MDGPQVAAGAGRLRGREPPAAAEDVQPEVGLHIHAGRGAK